jgi:tRNA(Arg) A34 adenosine deaminase TadA
MNSADNERWTRIAITRAQSSSGAQIAALVVDNDGIVAEGLSLVRTQCDPTAHTEINAIRAACQLRGVTKLINCRLYCTLELCGICLSACAWAVLEAVIFGADYAQVPDEYYEQIGYSALDRSRVKLRDGERDQLVVQDGCLDVECARLLPNWLQPAEPRIRLDLSRPNG